MILSLALIVGLLSAFVLAVVPDMRKRIARTVDKVHVQWTFGHVDGWTSRQSSPWPIVTATLLCAVSWAW